MNEEMEKHAKIAIMTKIGFTGTRHGMTVAQQEVLLTLLTNSPCQEFHHGDCIGADEQAHEIAKKLGLFIVIHPPLIAKWRANNGQGCRGDESREPKSYIERNHDIVDETDMLIAAPGGEQEELRSGTWSTVRYARKQNKPVFIIYPNGFVDGL